MDRDLADAENFFYEDVESKQQARHVALAQEMRGAQAAGLDSRAASPHVALGESALTVSVLARARSLATSLALPIGARRCSRSA